MSESKSEARTERCHECGDEFVTEPSWADEHVHVERRWSGGTGMDTFYFCSDDCAARYLSTGSEQEAGQ